MGELRKKIETYIPIIGGVFVMGIFLYLFIFEMSSDVVYTCNKDYKYHEDKKCPYICRGKKESVSITKMTIEEAKRRGDEPCGYCCD